jgi:hypothetical protein
LIFLRMPTGGRGWGGISFDIFENQNADRWKSERLRRVRINNVGCCCTGLSRAPRDVEGVKAIDMKYARPTCSKNFRAGLPGRPGGPPCGPCSRCGQMESLPRSWNHLNARRVSPSIGIRGGSLRKERMAMTLYKKGGQRWWGGKESQ